MADIDFVHGTCLAVDGRGVLLVGPSGAGKSDLALRLIDQPGHGLNGRMKVARLVSDDQVVLKREGDVVMATAPGVIAGQIELRGLGPVAAPATPSVPLTLVVTLRAAARIERLPEAADLYCHYLGVEIACLAIDASQASAPARIRAALDCLEQGHFPACQT